MSFSRIHLIRFDRFFHVLFFVVWASGRIFNTILILLCTGILNRFLTTTLLKHGNRSDEGLTLETSALKLFTMAILRY